MNIYLRTRPAEPCGYELALGFTLDQEPNKFTKAVIAAAIAIGVWVVFNVFLMEPTAL